MPAWHALADVDGEECEPGSHVKFEGWEFQTHRHATVSSSRDFDRLIGIDILILRVRQMEHQSIIIKGRASRLLSRLARTVRASRRVNGMDFIVASRNSHCQPRHPVGNNISEKSPRLIGQGLKDVLCILGSMLPSLMGLPNPAWRFLGNVVSHIDCQASVECGMKK